MIGYKAAIRGHRSILPPGIYLAHNARRSKPVFFERFGRFGHRSVVLDEEALVRQTDEIFLMKHESDAFDKVSLVLTWGEDDAELWRKSGRVGPERVVVTGNPRMDVLRSDLRAFHRPEIAAIRERFGDYVLLNTNFPTVNHFVAWSSTLKLAKSVTDARVIEQKSEFLSHKQALFERFQLLIPKLARAIAPLALVVRPHPSERHEPWLDAVSGASNASVAFEGSVVPWIAAARALIHNGCTSAVEAAVERRSIGRAREHRTPVGVWLRIFAANQRRLLKRRGRRFSAKAKARAAYRAHKFPGLTVEIADERIARFQGALSRFGGLRAREIRRDVLEIIG